MTIGAVVISRNDGYGGDQPRKAVYCLTSLLNALDEVIYVDWNSPNDVSLFDIIHHHLPKTGRLRHIQISQAQHREFVAEAIARIPGNHITVADAQHCAEAMARNIGLRRLNTDYRISCNADIMCLGRDSIQAGIIGPGAFHCVARRETPFLEIAHVAQPGTPALIQWMQANLSRFGQFGGGSPLGERDPWSLISCPGDFQLAHKDLWHGIRGLEESLVCRGYTDSNVQKKAALMGYDLRLVREIPVFHFGHYPNTGACGGTTCGMNDPDASLFNFNATTNPETWGFSHLTFPETTL